MNADSPPFARFWKTWRWGLLVAAASAVVWWLCFRHPVVWVTLGIGEANRPFLDLYALLAALDAIRQGADPLLPNALDPYNRPYGFSAWWFALEPLGLARKDVLWVGAALIAATALTAVAMARPANRRQAWLLGLLLVSPAMLLAVNRANSDLVIFVVVSLGLLCFRTASGTVRVMGVMLFAVAAVLKYFPLVTLIVLFDFRSRRAFFSGAGFYLLILVLAWPGLESAIRLTGKFAPAPEWLYAFGAPMLARDFGFQGPAYWLPPALGIGAWALWRMWRSPPLAQRRLPVSSDTQEREFICGAVMLVGVFFLGASYVYKFIFAIWLLPWLWAQHAGGPERRAARFLLGLILGVTWLEGLGASGLNLLADALSPSSGLALVKVILLVAQIATWVLVACLLRFVCSYFLRCWRALLAPAPAAA